MKTYKCLGPHLNMKARKRLYEAFITFNSLY